MKGSKVVEKIDLSNPHLMEVIIEKKEKLVKLASKNGLTSNETVKCSQELDILLNLFQRQGSC
jgi:hypothetical protein